MEAGSVTTARTLIRPPHEAHAHGRVSALPCRIAETGVPHDARDVWPMKRLERVASPRLRDAATAGGLNERSVTDHDDHRTAASASSNGLPFETDVINVLRASALRWSVSKSAIHFSTSFRAAQYVSRVLPNV